MVKEAAVLRGKSVAQAAARGLEVRKGKSVAQVVARVAVERRVPQVVLVADAVSGSGAARCFADRV